MGEIYRKGFSNKAAVRHKLDEDFYHSDLVRRLKEHGHRLDVGDLTLHLARETGFCYGVERTVQYAYETLERFPDSPLYITDEIIHNPQVNERLIDLGMRFLFGRYACGKSVDELGQGDVVLIPAFGAAVKDLDRLKQRGCILVDTTCGSVLNVWKNVERYAREGVTAVVHGKYSHEETRATVSQIAKYPGGRYLVVRDLEETGVVCEHIRRGGDTKAFLERFRNAVSPGFEPDRDLQRIGLANQTTMLCSESLEIQKRLREAVRDRHGDEALPKRFIAFDTICSATQDRQDTLVELLRTVRLDFLLVVGGFNSSNTGHLAEMGIEHVPTYHVENETGLISAEEIRCRDPRTGTIGIVRDWLLGGRRAVGVTAGASTPDNIVGRVLERLLALRGCTVDRPPLPAAVS
jgi:4-hydroxy-3-methylbut-2-enyl diphosphate reductase